MLKSFRIAARRIGAQEALVRRCHIYAKSKKPMDHRGASTRTNRPEQFDQCVLISTGAPPTSRPPISTVAISESGIPEANRIVGLGALSRRRSPSYRKVEYHAQERQHQHQQNPQQLPTGALALVLLKDVNDRGNIKNQDDDGNDWIHILPRFDDGASDPKYPELPTLSRRE